MANQKVFVYQSDDDLIVHPPLIKLGKGDTMEVINSSPVDVVWSVPRDVFGAGPHKESIKAKNRSGQRAQAGTVELATTYEITYDSKPQPRKAKGKSDPVIIIEL